MEFFQIVALLPVIIVYLAHTKLRIGAATSPLGLFHALNTSLPLSYFCYGPVRRHWFGFIPCHGKPTCYLYALRARETSFAQTVVAVALVYLLQE